MERKSFLKSLVTLIVAPTLLGDIAIKPYDDKKPQATFNSEVLRFYSDDIGRFRLGDLIVSDMGDKAIVVHISNMGKGQSFAEARPVVRNQYRYHDLNNVVCVARMIAA